jgi:hypothetical protein
MGCKRKYGRLEQPKSILTAKSSLPVAGAACLHLRVHPTSEALLCEVLNKTCHLSPPRFETGATKTRSVAFLKRLLCQLDFGWTIDVQTGTFGVVRGGKTELFCGLLGWGENGVTGYCVGPECGAVGRGNRTTRRKPAPVTLGSPQIPRYLTWVRTRAAAVGSRRLTS